MKRIPLLLSLLIFLLGVPIYASRNPPQPTPARGFFPTLPPSPTPTSGCSRILTEPTAISGPGSLDAPLSGVNFSQGAADAPATLTLYSDFHFEACKNIHPVMTEMQSQHQDLRLVFRRLPVIGVMDKSEQANPAVLAAQEQGKFWEMYSRLFTPHKEWTILPSAKFETRVIDEAADPGMDGDQFTAALHAPGTRTRMRTMNDAAKQSGSTVVGLILLNGEPFFMLNHQLLTDAIGIKAFWEKQITEKGSIILKLFPDQVPLAVNSFSVLARPGWYDRVAFLPSLVILIVLILGSLIFALFSLSAGFISWVNLATSGGDPAAEMIRAVSFGFISFFLLVLAWPVLQKTAGQEQADQPAPAYFSDWQIIPMFGLMGISVLAGALAAFSEMVWVTWIILPAATLFVIVPPIWLMAGYGTRRLPAGPLWRISAVIGWGLTIGPLIMILLEGIVLLGMILTGLLILLTTQPDALQSLAILFEQIQVETDEKILLNLLAPYLSNPVLIAAGMGYIALAVPMIEELLKPLAVWMFSTRLESPAQGFVLGAFSGAAFALLESLNAGADSTTTWPLIVTVRAGTSILHITASGLVGWGIASAVKDKRYGRLAGAYFSAVLIHGLWNAAAAGIGLSILGESIGRPEWFLHYGPSLVCGLMVMGVGMFAVLHASNRELIRQSQQTEREDFVTQEEVQSTS